MQFVPPGMLEHVEAQAHLSHAEHLPGVLLLRHIGVEFASYDDDSTPVEDFDRAVGEIIR